jgi:hypothetical protein
METSFRNITEYAHLVFLEQAASLDAAFPTFLLAPRHTDVLQLYLSLRVYFSSPRRLSVYQVRIQHNFV